MSWQKIVLPLTMEIDPKVVEIGKMGWEAYFRENKPDGFGMFHATEAGDVEINDLRIVYLTPVAAELCKEIAENYKLEPCDVPARDEPNMAFVLGDPKTMGMLQDSYQAKLAEAEAEPQMSAGIN